MVTRVYGTVEGVEVIFTPSSKDIWECIIPKTLNGEYVVELYAEDEAGNVGYFATVLFAVNAMHIITKFKVLGYASEIKVEHVHLVDHTKQYRITVTKCELCGGAVYGDD